MQDKWTEVIPQKNEPMEWGFCVNTDNMVVKYLRDVKVRTMTWPTFHFILFSKKLLHHTN